MTPCGCSAKLATRPEILTPVVDTNRPDVGVIAELGRIELMEGNYDSVLQHFESARRIMPRNSEINYAYASTLAALARHGGQETVRAGDRGPKVEWQDR